MKIFINILFSLIVGWFFLAIVFQLFLIATWPLWEFESISSMVDHTKPFDHSVMKDRLIYLSYSFISFLIIQVVLKYKK